jgi:hypothetical protein
MDDYEQEGPHRKYIEAIRKGYHETTLLLKNPKFADLLKNYIAGYHIHNE